jgi:hypothetical protein
LLLEPFLFLALKPDDDRDGRAQHDADRTDERKANFHAVVPRRLIDDDHRWRIRIPDVLEQVIRLGYGILDDALLDRVSTRPLAGLRRQAPETQARQAAVGLSR